MAQRPGQRLYQSAAFEVIGVLGQLMVALPNLDLFAGSSALWLRVAGLGLATLYVCVLLLRAFLPDPLLAARAGLESVMGALQVRLQAGNRAAVVPVALVAVLVAGFSLFGGAALGLTGDSSAPLAPTNLHSTGATAQQVDLAWDPAADHGSGVREYKVVRRDNGLERRSTSTSFHDTMGIGGGVTYEYSVVAVDGAGNVSNASEVRVTTPVSDTTACATDSIQPTPPGNPRASVVTATAVTLEWDAASDLGACGLAGYQLARDGIDTGIMAAGTTVTDDGLEPDHSYVYTVVAKDNAGNLSPVSEPVTVATLARPVQTQGPCQLTAPRGLRSTGVTTTSVALAWSAPEERCHLDAYRVYRGGSYVGQTTGTSFTVNGLAPGTSYVFTVRAHSSDGEMSSNSNAASAITATPPPPPDSTPPSDPANVGAVWTSSTLSLNLTWAAAVDGESGVKWYEVTLNGDVKGTTPGLGYSLGGLNPYTEYTVGVRAVNNVGLGSGLATASVTTGRAAGPFTAGLSPNEVFSDASTVVTVSGANVTAGAVVSLASAECGALGSGTAGPAGSFTISFTAEAGEDGSVVIGGCPLAGGAHTLEVSTVDDPSVFLTLTVTSV